MRRELSGFVAALLITALAPAPAGAFTALYAFGDSLSDAGNLFIATGGSTPPSPPYFQGEFSNGPNWVEDLSTQLGLGPVSPSLLPGGTDYAWGGATTGAPLSNNSAVPSGVQQVTTFLAAHGGHAPSTGLYTVWLGSNDVFNILPQLQNGTISGSTALSEARTAALYEAGEIASLAITGARTFIVPLVPDLGKTPYLLAQGPAAEAAATSLASTYNTALERDLKPLTAWLHGGLHFLDTFNLLDNAVKYPADYGLSNVTDPCFVAGAQPCTTPDTYLFWDGVHPTAKVDAIIAADAAALLAPAPFAFAAVVDPPAAPSPTPGAGLLSLGLLILIGLRRKALEFLARLSGI